MYDTLTITCKRNPEYNGTWHKRDVYDELRELNIRTRSDSDIWVEYVLSHVFEVEDIDDATIQAICMPNAASISWMS